MVVGQLLNSTEFLKTLYWKRKVFKRFEVYYIESLQTCSNEIKLIKLPLILSVNKSFKFEIKTCDIDTCKEIIKI